MATKEELQAQADAEIEAAKPLKKSVNGVVSEFDENDYAQAKIDLGNSKWEEQQFGYITARQQAFESTGNQLDQLFWDIHNNKLDKTGEWYKAIKKIKDDNPKPE
tara:strand:- start:83 stop:397 length:315 start_codon:yes stop_codon:yes gene_type:complete